MRNKTSTTPSITYIEKVENVNMDKLELATTSYIYIEKVENLYRGKVGLTNADSPSYNQQPSAPSDTSTMPTLDNSKLALAIYCVLESWGVHPRVNVSVADIARLVHLLSGKAYTCVDNSVFYKKLKRAPNFKTDRSLVKDLEVLKRSFLAVELKAASLIVEKELKVARQEIKYSS